MKIDKAKLQRIEASEKKEHAYLMVVMEDRNHAQANLQKIKSSLDLWLGNQSPKVLKIVRDGGYQPSKCRGELEGLKIGEAVIERLEEIEKLQEIADSASKAFEEQQNKWELSAKPLNVLRKFVEDYDLEVAKVLALQPSKHKEEPRLIADRSSPTSW